MTVRLALIGLGTVGSAVAARLRAAPDLLTERAGRPLELVAVAVRDPGRPRQVLANSGVTVTGDAEEMVAGPGIDIVVEVMGGVEPARGLVVAALEAGRAVVTANKELIALHGQSLLAVAARNQVSLRFGAAAGGGLPVVEILTSALRGDRIRRIDAILNGTTNFILDRMAGGAGYAGALAEAQRRGFAEADPRLDVEGYDAASKIAMVASLAWRGWIAPDLVRRVGISGVEKADIAMAARLGRTVKLVATARDLGGSVTVSAHPTVVPLSHPLASTSGSDNAVLLDCDLAGQILLRGPGAGGSPTASAVINDIIGAARSQGIARSAPDLSQSLEVASTETDEAGAYVRVKAAGGGETAGRIVQALEDRGVGVGAVGEADGDVVVLTGATSAGVLDRALETLDSLPFVSAVSARLDLLEPGG